MQPAPDADVNAADDELPLLMIRVVKAMLLELAAEPGAPAPGELTPIHGIATRYLDGHHDVTTVELAEHLHVTKQSASEIVGALERAGYVGRRPHPDDGRARVIELTAEGREALAGSRARWGQLVDGWEAAAGADDLATVRRTLEANLDARADPT